MTPMFDSRSFLIKGRRQLLLSGAIHYWRSTPAMWPELLRQAREGGLNCVETVVAWGQHEPLRDHYDFSGRRDLRRFCECAAEAGLQVFLRPGPYVCAELDFGGFPSWLRDVRGIRFRTRNAAYYEEVSRWFGMLFNHLRAQFVDRGGPIVALQVENEYANIAELYGADGVAYMNWLRDLIAGFDLGVPLTSCNPAGDENRMAAVTPLARTTPTLNSGFAHPFVLAFKKWAPDSPCLWTEAWTSWYQIWGSARPWRPAADLAYCVARFFSEGGKGINYYMWHGGTNFGRDGMYLQATQYDYDAPLDEFGCTTLKYDLLQGLHRVLSEYQDLITSNELPERFSLEPDVDVRRYREAGRSLVFLCRDAPIGASRVTVRWGSSEWTLGGRAVVAIDGERELWRVEGTAEHDAPRRNFHPLAISGAWSQSRETPPANGWEQMAQPREQLEATRNQSDYAWYETDLVVREPAGESGRLVVEGINDFFQIFVDDERVAISQTHLLEDRGAWEGPDYTQGFDLTLSLGAHRLRILVSSLGLVKGDWQAGRRNMVEERKGFWGRATWIPNQTARNFPARELGPWRRHGGLIGEARKNCVGLSDGAPLHSTEIGHPLWWYEWRFDQPLVGAPMAFDLSTLGKGLAWLNGECLGRFWSIAARVPEVRHTEHNQVMEFDREEELTQRYYHAPRDWLKAKGNRLVIFAETGGDPAGVRLAQWR